MVGVVVLLVGCLLQLQREEPAAPPARAIESARFIPLASAVPPPTDAPDWQPTTLPDDWWTTRPRTAAGWYEATFDLPAVPDRLWAIYLPRVSMNAAVYLGGRMVGSGGRFDPPTARNWQRPLYFTVPASALRAGRNVVLIRVVATPPGSGMLARPWIGPDAVLRGSYHRRLLLDVTIPLVIAVATAGMGLAMLLIWALRRDRVYGWFGLGMLVWAARDVNLLVVDSSLPGVFWDWLWIMGIGWVILLIVPFVHALLGIERPRVDRAVLAYGLAHSVVLTAIAVLRPTELVWFWRYVWDPLLLPIGVYPTFLMLRAAGRSADLAANAVLASGLVVFVLALHDLLLLVGIIPRANGFLFHYGALPVVVVFGSVLLLRFVDGLREVEALNRSLERRVDEKTAEIERSYRHVAEVETDRARREEREGILREVHDGVGAQIVATLAMLESGHADRQALADTLREALDELRLTVDTLGSGAGRDAVTALAMLRRRLQPKVEAAGVRFVWRVANDVPLPRLGDELTLDLLRIVQEAVTNALQHGNARSVEVSIMRGPDGVALAVAVTDDGQGMCPEPAHGQGLPNMRRRAERLGAVLDVRSSPRGTRVAIVLGGPSACGSRSTS